MLTAFDNFPALLIWLPLLGGIVAFFLKQDKSVRTWALLSSIVTLAVFALSLKYTDGKEPALTEVSYYWLNDLGSHFAFKLDGLSWILCLLNTLAFPIIIVATWRNEVRNPGTFYGLLLLSQCGMMGVFMATDALVFYFFWELALIPVYFLASQWGGERRIQAAFKFFIYTFVGSLLMLVGIIYVFLHTPDQSFALNSFYAAKLSSAEQFGLFWLFFIAFAIKMPIFPFHTWQPDAYDQAPAAVTMVLSGVMVKMGVFAVMRWLLPLLPEASKHFDKIVIGLSVTGMVYASLLAMRQDNLKRLVAYSSIAHIGLMCAALFSLNTNGMQGVMLQMFNHGVNIIGLWVVVDLIERQTGVRQISQLGGIAQKAPVLTILLVVIALANVALPLTNAFVGEFLMFSGLYRFSPVFAAVAGLSIILSAVYTLNMIKHVFYGETNALTEKVKDPAVDERIILAVVVVLIFIVGVYPGPLFDLVQQSTESILLKTAGK